MTPRDDCEVTRRQDNTDNQPSSKKMQDALFDREYLRNKPKHGRRGQADGVRSLILIPSRWGQVFDLDSRSFKSKHLTLLLIKTTTESNRLLLEVYCHTSLLIKNKDPTPLTPLIQKQRPDPVDLFQNQRPDPGCAGCAFVRFSKSKT